MTQQSMKQQARRTAREATARRRRERAEREHRVETLVVEVLTAIGERDGAEQRAGMALERLVRGERLSVREAVEWCNGQLSVREVTRLRQVARTKDTRSSQDQEVMTRRTPGSSPGGK